MNQINVGIIGCGSITKNRHAPEYQENPNVKEIVFYDRNPERAQALAETFNGRVAETIEDLLDDPSISAISDCSSNENHPINTTKALRKGKHVLCEKPLATSLEEAEKMVEIQHNSGKKLMVAHNQRFDAPHQKAKEIIHNEELGKVLTFKTSFGHKGPEHWGYNKTNSTWFFKKDRSVSGVVGDLGIHKIDLIHYLLDDEITDGHSFKGALDKVDENGEPIEVCDNLVCALKTKKGRIGTASFSWTYYGKQDNSTTIYCEKGIIKIYPEKDVPLAIETPDGEVQKPELPHHPNSGVIDSFVDSVIQDTEPFITGEDALASLKVVDMLLE
ncbi:Gfo/Idh/MocA family protein [Pontibacillus marinus]|uniref:NADH-dependent dehydrogenase n=1 Tax=Pontibacillus marinus BH030004 = DSM 16465 TaxID=1385511 RepID=A0A0A5GEX7_9BACI|nr:Gfo/Idh/MocA family oxidoreductase [Pontibacillus marinus]KGX89680.1 NADH-dependent dehydrogenase [Pontibacillus marinus BH030004 = DSM 16465]